MIEAPFGDIGEKGLREKKALGGQEIPGGDISCYHMNVR